MAKHRPRNRRKSPGALVVVRKARTAAKNALDSLRREIQDTRTRLESLVTEEKSFRDDLFGGSSTRQPRHSTRKSTRKAAAKARKGTAKRRGRRRTVKPRKAPIADGYFNKLPSRFSLDEVRKVAGKRAPISLAQWSRAKRIKKIGTGYQKTSS